jgi:murein DD-endopeptidase MepM/ murein hydrolase activator NlpD
MAQDREAHWGYPLAFPGHDPGDGCFIKHGYACENAESYPGLLHTGENWYGLERNATEAEVIAAAAGIVRYADFDYPGRVVIIEHEPALFSQYGHLDYNLAVSVGDRVERGDRIGAPLSYPGDFTRSHLHFEIRTFFISDRINGNHPSHGFTCGYQCPPGPGYWPIDAPEHPSDLGWLNPTHVIARRSFPDGPRKPAVEIVRTEHAKSKTVELWSAPPWKTDTMLLVEIEVAAGDPFALTQIAAGPEASRGRNAGDYRLWYRIEHEQREAWVQAITTSGESVGLDGAPSSLRLDFVFASATD